jgi:potassium efflux system protein
MRRVRETLERVGREVTWRSQERDPVVLLTDFADSSVNWELSIWMDEPWRSPRAASEVREKIWWALKEAELVIAFPQLDVHFDPPVEEALTRLPRSA